MGKVHGKAIEVEGDQKNLEKRFGEINDFKNFQVQLEEEEVRKRC